MRKSSIWLFFLCGVFLLSSDRVQSATPNTVEERGKNALNTVLSAPEVAACEEEEPYVAALNQFDLVVKPNTDCVDPDVANEMNQNRAELEKMINTNSPIVPTLNERLGRFLDDQKANGKTLKVDPSDPFSTAEIVKKSLEIAKEAVRNASTTDAAKTPGTKTASQSGVAQNRVDFLGGANLLSGTGGNQIPVFSERSGGGISQASPGHGSTSRLSGAGLESVSQTSAALSRATQVLRDSVEAQSNKSRVLNDTARARVGEELLGLARISAQIPVDGISFNTPSIANQFTINDKSGDIKKEFSSLLKKDALGQSVTNNQKELEALAGNSSFQNQAVSLLGKKAAQDFNLAVLGASLVSLPDSTEGDVLGANNVLSGKLSGVMSELGIGDAGKQLVLDEKLKKVDSDFSVDDWMEAARILSSPAVTARISDPVKAAEVKDAYVELLNLKSQLVDYRSVEVLEMVSVPLKKDFLKIQNEALARLQGAVRKTVLSLRGLNPQALKGNPNLQSFSDALELMDKELAQSPMNPEKIRSLFEEQITLDVFRRTWMSFDNPSFIVARKSLAEIVVSHKFAPLKNAKGPQSKMTRLIFSSFTYLKILRENANQKEMAQKKKNDQKSAKERSAEKPGRAGFDNDPF